MEERVCSKCNHKQKIRTKLKKFTCSSCGTNNFMRNTINNSALEKNSMFIQEPGRSLPISSTPENISTDLQNNIGEIKKEDKKKLILD